jgi:hypothetical protein
VHITKAASSYKNFFTLILQVADYTVEKPHMGGVNNVYPNLQPITS